MTGGSGTCIPAVEMRHLLDELDGDGGPLQLLALRAGEPVAETARETVPVAVSDVGRTVPDVGYPLAV